jgi:ribosomal protein L40E
MTAFVEFSTAVVCLDCNAVSAAPQGKCVRCTSTAVMTLADKLGHLEPSRWQAAKPEVPNV